MIAIGGTSIAFCAPPGAPRRRRPSTSLGPHVAELLTPAQRRVLVALCRPFRDSSYATPATNQQIADELVVSVDAVKSNLRALFERVRRRRPAAEPEAREPRAAGAAGRRRQPARPVSGRRSALARLVTQSDSRRDRDAYGLSGTGIAAPGRLRASMRVSVLDGGWRPRSCRPRPRCRRARGRRRPRRCCRCAGRPARAGRRRRGSPRRAVGRGDRGRRPGPATLTRRRLRSPDQPRRLAARPSTACRRATLSAGLRRAPVACSRARRSRGRTRAGRRRARVLGPERDPRRRARRAAIAFGAPGSGDAAAAACPVRASMREQPLVAGDCHPQRRRRSTASPRGPRRSPAAAARDACRTPGRRGRGDRLRNAAGPDVAAGAEERCSGARRAVARAVSCRRGGAGRRGGRRGRRSGAVAERSASRRRAGGERARGAAGDAAAARRSARGAAAAGAPSERRPGTADLAGSARPASPRSASPRRGAAAPTATMRSGPGPAPAAAASAARPRSPADGNRSSGRLASARRDDRVERGGHAGPRASGGGSERCAHSLASSLSRRNGGRPVST